MALRSSPREAGSWFHLSQDTTLSRDADCDLSSLACDTVPVPRLGTRCHRPSVLDWTPRPIVSACHFNERCLPKETAGSKQGMGQETSTFEENVSIAPGLLPPKDLRRQKGLWKPAIHNARRRGLGRCLPDGIVECVWRPSRSRWPDAACAMGSRGTSDGHHGSRLLSPRFPRRIHVQGSTRRPRVPRSQGPGPGIRPAQAERPIR